MRSSASPLAALFLFVSCGSTVSITALRANCPIVVDGDPAEWQSLPPVFLDGAVQLLTVAEDRGALAVMFRFAERHLAETIARYGVTLWLDAERARSKRFGIRYHGSAELVAELLEDGGR